MSKFHDLFHAVLRTVQVTDIAEDLDNLHVTAHICYNVEDLEEYVVGLERRIAELEAVLREVAKSPWAYSDPASLLATLGRRAERVLYAPLDAAGERKPSEKTT